MQIENAHESKMLIRRLPSLKRPLIFCGDTYQGQGRLLERGERLELSNQPIAGRNLMRRNESEVDDVLKGKY